jgi:hypothetical protein
VNVTADQNATGGQSEIPYPTTTDVAAGSQLVESCVDRRRVRKQNVMAGRPNRTYLIVVPFVSEAESIRARPPDAEYPYSARADGTSITIVAVLESGGIMIAGDPQHACAGQ